MATTYPKAYVYRHFTQVAVAAQLVEEHLDAVGYAPDGTRKISTCFGHIVASPRRGMEFVPGFSEQIASAVLSHLTSCTTWAFISDWEIEHRFHVGDSTVVHVTFEEGIPLVTTRRKTNEYTTDFTYTEAVPPLGRKDAAAWKLRDKITRVVVAHDTVILPQAGDDARDMLQVFEAVDIVVAKRFVIRSASSTSLSWCFTVTRTWTGKTLQATELLMVDTPGTWNMECSPIETSSTGAVPESNQYFALSLFMKIQDVMDMPLFADMCHAPQHGRIPVAEFINVK